MSAQKIVTVEACAKAKSFNVTDNPISRGDSRWVVETKIIAKA
jgi:hypothetical protein